LFETNFASFYHPLVSIVLLDLRIGKFRWRESDRRVQVFAELFDLETDDEKVVRTVKAIGDILPLETSLSGLTLAEELEMPMRIVVIAMRHAAQKYRLYLDDVPGFGWVIS